MAHLFHFSDDPSIDVFRPRPVRVPSARSPGQEWLNGPLVWAINEDFQALYLFPRNCPRIVVYKIEGSSDDDIETYWGHSDARFLVFVEQEWFDALWTSEIYRYTLPSESFEDFGERGISVSRQEIRPRAMDRLTELPRRLAEQGAELRLVQSLSALKPVWETSLHASGIRLRNASTWQA